MELNETGRQQASDLARYLGREKIDAIYSSDLRRALQTAGPIGESQGLEVRVDRRFREMDQGELEGLTFEEVRASRADFISRWRTEPAELLVPGGERLIDVERRAWEGIERITGSHLADQTVVVVSHNFPIVSILCRVTGTDLNHYRNFRIEPGALRHISHNGSGWRVARLDPSLLADPK